MCFGDASKVLIWNQKVFQLFLHQNLHFHLFFCFIVFLLIILLSFFRSHVSLTYFQFTLYLSNSPPLPPHSLPPLITMAPHYFSKRAFFFFSSFAAFFSFFSSTILAICGFFYFGLREKENKNENE